MNISLFFLILKARIKIVLVTFFITVLAATVVSLFLPKVYKATTQLVLNYKGVDSLTGSPIPALQMPGYMETQADIIKNRSVALKVVDELKLAESEFGKREFMAATEGRGQIREWLAGFLLRKLDVEPSRESSVLSISFNGRDPAVTAAVANAFANSYLELSTQLKVEPAQKAANYFSKQVKELRDNMEQAQAKLSKYQQEKGITSADEKLDVENARLNELSQQLTIAQSLAIEARSRQQNTLNNATDSPDVAVNPVIQSLRIDAGKAESKLAELSERLGTNHPQYQAAKAELSKIQGQLQNAIHSTSNSISGTAQIQQKREEDLRTQVALQKTKVLELNRLRDELSVLQKDVETAQKAMDAVAQRFSQTSIEGQSNPSDISVLNPAQPPGSPASPKIALNILLSVFLGGLLGIGFGLLAELMNRRVRSSNDLAELLNVPVVVLMKEKPAVIGLKLLPGQSGRALPSA